MAKANFQEDEAGYIEREADFLADDTRKACKEYFDAKRDKKRAEKARKILHVFANAQELCKNFKINDDSSGQKWKYKRASVILKDAANEKLPLCYTMVKESERMSETDKHKMAKYVFSIARDIRKMIESELEEWNETTSKS